MAFIVSVGMLAAFLQNMSGSLVADPNRDRMLHIPIQQFFEGSMPAEQLRLALRDYAQQFEAKPYKVSRINLDLSTVPSNRLNAWSEVLLPLIGPTLRAFKDGKITPAQAALKVAPFVLVFGGPYGFDPPGPDRSEELTQAISEFAAPEPAI